MNNPAEIASASFALIRHEMAERGIAIAPPLDALVERIIHSTADFEFAALTQASPGAVEAGVAALRAGCPVISDVRMIQVGISGRRLAALGGALHCFVADSETAQLAAEAGITRSAAGIRRAAALGLLDGALVAIGNAPTALYEIIDLMDHGLRPALVVGVPVGFINTAESKQALVERSSVPWIVTSGRKGGSPVAVAIVNALLRLASGADAAEVD